MLSLANNLLLSAFFLLLPPSDVFEGFPFFPRKMKKPNPWVPVPGTPIPPLPSSGSLPSGEASPETPKPRIPSNFLPRDRNVRLA